MQNFALMFPTIPKSDNAQLTDYSDMSLGLLTLLTHITPAHIKEALEVSWPMSRFMSWQDFVSIWSP